MALARGGGARLQACVPRAVWVEWTHKIGGVGGWMGCLAAPKTSKKTHQTHHAQHLSSRYGSRRLKRRESKGLKPGEVCAVKRAEAQSKLYPRSSSLTRHIQSTNRSTGPKKRQSRRLPAAAAPALCVGPRSRSSSHEQQHEQQLHAAHMTACFYSGPPPPPPTMTMAGAPRRPTSLLQAC